MGNGLLDQFRNDVKGRGIDFDEFGVEADPDMERSFLVGDVPESQVDQAATLGESLGFDEITFEPSSPGRELLRFGKRRK